MTFEQMILSDIACKLHNQEKQMVIRPMSLSLHLPEALPLVLLLLWSFYL